ncbi:MAG: hypothetical protein AB7P22_03390 [Vicinamibacterales bacterium]
MSLTKEGRKVRSQSGKGFLSTIRFTDAIAAALHQQYGDSHGAVKSVMHVAGVRERTVKNWFQAKNGPNGESLVQLCRHSDQVLETVLRLAGREKHLKIKKFGEMKGLLRQMLALLAEIEEI